MRHTVDHLDNNAIALISDPVLHKAALDFHIVIERYFKYRGAFCDIFRINPLHSHAESEQTLDFRHLPCAPERLEQADRRLQPRQPNLCQLILGLEKCALRVK